jgi:hypothetical protein
MSAMAALTDARTIWLASTSFSLFTPFAYFGSHFASSPVGTLSPSFALLTQNSEMRGKRIVVEYKAPINEHDEAQIMDYLVAPFGVLNGSH